MAGPMIENSERGITVNKTLAWTMVGGLMAAGFFLGTELSTTKTLLTEIKSASEASRVEMRVVTTDIDTRLRAVETHRASDASEIRAVQREVNSLTRAVNENNSLLRQALQDRGPAR